MPLPPKRHTETLVLPNLDGTCDVIAAGKDPVFTDLKPDGFTAYARVRFGKALPQVTGPESISGAVFGIHPAVLARSYQGIVHKQVNLGHQLVSLGKKEDRICGCVLQAAFPQEPEGGWQIPDTPDEAPHITAVSALFKQAKGVPKMLGDHLGGKIDMSCSMEFTYYLDEMGIYDPATRETYDRKDIPKNLLAMTYEDEKGRLCLKKMPRGNPLVIALGGLSYRLVFSGYGYTEYPAEDTAAIEVIAASRREEGMMVCGSVAEIPAYAPGMPVAWKGGQFNRGTVAAVLVQGSHSIQGRRVQATLENPALVIRLPDGKRIVRSASGVVKNS